MVSYILILKIFILQKMSANISSSCILFSWILQYNYQFHTIFLSGAEDWFGSNAITNPGEGQNLHAVISVFAQTCEHSRQGCRLSGLGFVSS